MTGRTGRGVEARDGKTGFVLTCVGFGCSFIQVSSIFDTMYFLPISEALNTEAFLQFRNSIF